MTFPRGELPQVAALGLLALLLLLAVVANAATPSLPEECVVDRVEGGLLVVEAPGEGWLHVPAAMWPHVVEGDALPCPE